MFTEKLYGHVKVDMMAQNDMEDSLEKVLTLGTNGSINLQKPQSMITDLGKALLQAAKSGNTEKVHELMSRGAPFTADWLGTSPLHLAARYNHVETCKVLLRAGISKDSKTKVDRTPLHLAVFYGNVEIVELLLNSKCEIDAQDMLKMTPLHWAVQNRHDNIVEMLLQQGADPNAESKFGKTPISIATDAGYGDLVRILLLANQMRAASTDQTQEATDNLMYELQLHKDRHVDTEDNITMDLSNDDSISNLSSSHREDTTDTDNIIEKEDSLSDVIINLAQGSEANQRNLDSNTLQMLKDIGISMLPSDDTAGSLITSAIQRGRKLVLSEAGKFALHETRSQLANVEHGKTQYALPGRAKTVKIVSQAGTQQQQQQQVASHAGVTPTIKTNKVIKVLTKEEFNQICAGDVSALKKISATSCRKQLQTTAPMRVPQPVVRTQTSASTISSTGQKTVKKIVLSRNRIGSTENLVAKAGAVVNSSGNNGAASAIIGASAIGFHANGLLGSGSNVSNRHIITSADGVKRMRTSAGLEIISKLPKIPMDTVVSVEGTPNPPIAHRLVSVSTAVRSVSSSRSSSVDTSPSSAGTVPVAPVNAVLATANSSSSATSSMTDFERQFLELKKQNDDLRKQFELLQKQNDDYRLRLEKVEKEVQTLKQGNASNPNSFIEII